MVMNEKEYTLLCSKSFKERHYDISETVRLAVGNGTFRFLPQYEKLSPTTGEEGKKDFNFHKRWRNAASC